MSIPDRRLLWFCVVVSTLTFGLLIADRFFPGIPHSTARKQSALPIPADYATFTVEELAMRFREPDYYTAEAEHDMPRWAAVREMLRRGLLKRGMGPEEAEFLLGAPYNATPEERARQMKEWLYGISGGNLRLQFGPDQRLSGLLHTHDGEPDVAGRTDDLLSSPQ